jgi:hypothetical protein
MQGIGVVDKSIAQMLKVCVLKQLAFKKLITWDHFNTKTPHRLKSSNRGDEKKLHIHLFFLF